MGRRKSHLSPPPSPNRLTDGGRRVVTLTRPNKTPVLQARPHLILAFRDTNTDTFVSLRPGTRDVVTRVSGRK